MKKMFFLRKMRLYMQQKEVIIRNTIEESKVQFDGRVKELFFWNFIILIIIVLLMLFLGLGDMITAPKAAGIISIGLGTILIVFVLLYYFLIYKKVQHKLREKAA